MTNLAGKLWLRKDGVIHAFRPEAFRSICGDVLRVGLSPDLKRAGASCKACTDAPFDPVDSDESARLVGDPLAGMRGLR